jgi:DNA-binding NtrC family response regulator
MKDAKIFFIDLNPANEAANTLLDILKTSTKSGFQIQYQCLKECESILCDCELCNVILQSNSDLVLMSFSSDYLEQSKQLFQYISEYLFNLPIIVVFESCNPNEVFSMLQAGAADFITPPFKAIDILPRLWRLIKYNKRAQSSTDRIKEKIGLKNLVGKSSTFLKVIRRIPIVAKCDASVLISGETGTGKEICARAVHYISPRADKPFIPFNCGAIPTDLMENELFGHEQGAFTGASSNQPGLISEANNGT